MWSMCRAPRWCSRQGGERTNEVRQEEEGLAKGKKRKEENTSDERHRQGKNESGVSSILARGGKGDGKERG